MTGALSPGTQQCVATRPDRGSLDVARREALLSTAQPHEPSTPRRPSISPSHFRAVANGKVARWLENWLLVTHPGGSPGFEFADSMDWGLTVLSAWAGIVRG